MAYISFQPTDFFNSKIYTGTGSSNALTGLGFQPDIVWIKGRNYAYNHVLSDSVRGEKQLYPNLTNAQDSNTGEITSFDSDGFTVGTGGDVNYNTRTFVSWNWKMGTTSGATFGTAGITPTNYSINTTTGQGVYKYSGGDGFGASTVAHGLGAAPDCVIIKRIEDDGHGWQITNTAVGFDVALKLESTGAESDTSAWWNDTAPTSDVVSIGGDSWNNLSGKTFMMYCFTNKRGYFKTGVYTGYGNANGTFVHTGFRPAVVMGKVQNATDSWHMWDNKRDPTNVVERRLEANSTSVEHTSIDWIDFVSNGFKHRYGGDGNNKIGTPYLYMAFAEFPFVSSNSKPGTAR